MNSSNSDLRNSALDALRGNWVNAILAFVIYSLISGIGAPVILLIGGALSVGISIFSLKMARGERAEIEDVFAGFDNFVNTIVAYLLFNIFVFLWSLLLIVPGIIKAISYSQTFFILAEDNQIRGMDAIDKSELMMRGYKMKYFTLSLLFVILIILSGILLFIPLFWLIPYMYVTYANFYDDIKNKALLQ